MAIIRSESGANLNNWTLVVGDGLYHHPSEAPVQLSDIKTIDQTNHSVVKANVDARRIMAHNITYHKVVDNVALTCTHTASYKFKMPYTISTGNTDFNGQTVEGGLFVWDGATAELDFGLAFQWVINPWDPNYKAFRCWDGSGWVTLGSLNPDTAYHTVDFELDIQNQEAFISLDGFKFAQNVFSSTPKTGWSAMVEARFQAETISIFPAPTGTVPKQKVHFKDWTWDWEEPLV